MPAAIGVLPVSEEGLAVEAGVVASVAGGLTVSEEGLAVAAGVLSAVCVAESLRECVGRRVVFAAGVLAFREVGLSVTVGTAASSGALTGAEDGLTVGAGAASVGELTGAEDGLTVGAGAAASAGALTVGEGEVTVVGAVGSAAGVLTVGEDGLVAGEVGVAVGAGA